MKTLVLDTSSKFLYVSILNDKQEIFFHLVEGKNNHSDNLIRVINEGLTACNLELKNFDRIIVGIGPGSYTGLRVSLTIAKMFSWTLNIPLYTVSSLDILASGYFKADGIYAITSIAKKSYIYGKLIKVKDGIQSIIIDDEFLDEQTFYNKIRKERFFLVNSNNYLFDPNYLNINLVNELHSLSPNYLQMAI